MQFDSQKTYILTKIKESHPGNIEIGYWAAGTIAEEPEIGHGIFMFRIANSKNIDGKYGTFSTSRVLDITKNENHWDIQTLNSVYKLEIYAN